ncbi:hypothetical protein MTF65_03460 [Streptomyces sp. APSN-46.1]|uniref:hypothetical protein n=1 Tax=Streptomyces sp. APSN-46.1 TaxID=2929049 RepID=UPI001FB35BBD|nr:hypothetical protein [Streptomyces sp. APSN-46.1]MCJ1676422.1 hypothetical protein [Streptomyces sp. APSN-46.1]
MVIAFLIFLALGLVVSVTPGAVLGYFFVVTSRRLRLRARIPLLLVVAAGSSAMWMILVGAANVFRPAILALSFAATLVSGITFLLHEAGKRRAARFPAPAWPGYRPPAGQGWPT